MLILLFVLLDYLFISVLYFFASNSSIYVVCIICGEHQILGVGFFVLSSLFMCLLIYCC